MGGSTKRSALRAGRARLRNAPSAGLRPWETARWSTRRTRAQSRQNAKASMLKDRPSRVVWVRTTSEGMTGARMRRRRTWAARTLQQRTTKEGDDVCRPPPRMAEGANRATRRILRTRRRRSPSGSEGWKDGGRGCEGREADAEGATDGCCRVVTFVAQWTIERTKGSTRRSGSELVVEDPSPFGAAADFAVKDLLRLMVRCLPYAPLSSCRR